MRNFYLVVFYFGMIHVSFGQTLSIEGNENVCVNQCLTYQVVNGLGGPYVWSTSGEIIENTTNSQIEICWNTVKSNFVKVVDLSQLNNLQNTAQKTISVAAIPNAELIIPENSVCDIINNDSSFSQGQSEFPVETKLIVCPNSVQDIYFTASNKSNLHEWTIEGGSIIYENAEKTSIQWNTSGLGSIEYKVINSNGCEDILHYQVEIIVELNAKIHNDKTVDPSLSICLGDEVNFTGSVDTESSIRYNWFIDGKQYSGKNIHMKFDNPGTSNVMLVATTPCGCTDTAYYPIFIENLKAPELLCLGMVCPGSVVTYKNKDRCANYLWSVSSEGSILDGGTNNDDFITIQWNTGPTGVLSLETTSCEKETCSNVTKKNISILDGESKIEGPKIVCNDDKSFYHIQFYEGVEYNWELMGPGTIVSGQGSHEIEVLWNANQSFETKLIVKYENCLLGCGGKDSIIVKNRPRASISGLSEICLSESVYYIVFSDQNYIPNEGTWQVEFPDGTINSFPTRTFLSFTPTQIGKHIIYFKENQDKICNPNQTFVFHVLEKPKAPEKIYGPTTICKGEKVTYFVPKTNQDQSVTWRVKDGTKTTYFNSESIEVTWLSNGPYILEVAYYQHCLSDYKILNIQSINQAKIDGPNEICKNIETVFFIDGLSKNTYDWKIIPENAGSLKSIPDGSVRIHWNKEGTHQISVDICGKIFTHMIEVKGIDYQLTFPETICKNDPANVQINVSSDVKIEVYNSQDILVGNTNITTVSNGSYWVKLTTDLGCLEQEPFIINSFPEYNIRVSSLDTPYICLPHPGVKLEGLISSGNTFLFNWYFNGNPMGKNSTSIVTSVPGDYHISFIDQNGCTNASNTYILEEKCPGARTCFGGGTAIGEPPIFGCDNNGFFVDHHFGNNEKFWVFDYPNPLSDTQIAKIPFYRYKQAGYYNVLAISLDLKDTLYSKIEVPVAPSFEFNKKCFGTPIDFINTSTMMPNVGIVKYEWNFDDPASGTNNTSTAFNASHNFSALGIYTVRLAVTNILGCISVFEKEVEIESNYLAYFPPLTNVCAEQQVNLIAQSANEILNYEWRFNDLTNTFSDTVTGEKIYYTFLKEGKYNISLSVKDKTGCRHTYNDQIDIYKNTMDGQITTDKPLPVCKNEVVKLTAPSSAQYYFWNTGEETSTIDVSTSETFSVTMIDNNGCLYTPDPLLITIKNNINVEILGNLESLYTELYSDSMTICQNQNITLRTQSIFLSTYQWTDGSNNQYLNLNNLLPGRHEFTVTVTSTQNGCALASDKYLVIVNPLPDATVISSLKPVNCEREQNTLYVKNPKNNYNYFWNTGVKDQVIQVREANSYFVEVYNEFGCTNNSNEIVVSKKPPVNVVHKGCTQLCFPETICLPKLNDVINYQWLLDEIPVGSPTNAFGELVANQAGDYKLILTNSAGCKDTSQVLTVNAEPFDQSIEGILFFDKNKNDIFDGDDELLSGMELSLFDGNILLQATVSDVNGHYNFDPITAVNPHIVVDTFGTNFTLVGDMFFESFFDQCDEHLIKDFPFRGPCDPSESNLIIHVCSAEQTNYEGYLLYEGDELDLVKTNVMGCDSIIHITVEAYPDPKLAYLTPLLCHDSNGIIEVIGQDAHFCTYSLDNITFTSGTFFDNLELGDHTLFVRDSFGCMSSLPIQLQALDIPNIELESTNSCYGESGGQLFLNSPNVDITNFIFNNNIFDPTDTLKNLSPGLYSLEVSYLHCVLEKDFLIGEWPQYNFAFDSQPTCPGESNGVVEILYPDSLNFRFSLNGLTFGNQSVFNSLSEGDYNIEIEDENNCLYQQSFSITAFDPMEILVETQSSCEDISNGSVSILSDGLQYSLDGINYHSSNQFFELSAGDYTIYMIDSNSCVNDHTVNIDTYTVPNLTVDSKPSCHLSNTGSISLLSNDQDLLYSLNGANFSDQQSFSELGVGLQLLKVQYGNACFIDLEVEIFETPPMEMGFVEEEGDCQNRKVEITALPISGTNMSYMWNDGQQTSSRTIVNSGIYTLSISDDCGTMEKIWTIDLDEENLGEIVFAPNVFYAGHVGVNGCFVPQLKENLQLISYKLTIYDRWGNLMFLSNEKEECWNGKFKGEILNPAVFVWILDITYLDCEVVKSTKKYGDITLIK